VREVPASLLKKLELGVAAEAEAATWRNLLPPEPWAEVLISSSGHFAHWVSARLQAGHRNAPGWVVDARKAHQAFRPVPIVGIAERIAYRALTEWVLKDVVLPERTQDDYKAFAAGPIMHAFAGAGIQRLSDAKVEYVVQADISSYYQYVDHGVLLNELENRTGKIDASRLLIELLGEIQGATYGLPQLLDPSDNLSEVYIQALERDVTRRIGQVWRFNDDFRLAVNGYGNAQQALEQLSAAARPLGLVLNDRKSSILRFDTYFWRYHVGDSGDADTEVNPAEIEVWVDDYPDMDREALTETAEATLSRLDEDAADPIDLSETPVEDIKNLRRAFNILAREASSSGLAYAEQVFRFVPQLTPRLADYLVASDEAEHDIQGVWRGMAAQSEALNVWQRAWMTYVARKCDFLQGDDLEWIRDQFEAAPPGLLHAEAALTLAIAGEMDFTTLDTALRTQPEALAPWYALAINHVQASADQRTAVRGSSRLYELLVSASSS
jgi:hypothetical protein